jgi:hypothetical protein
MTKSLIGPNAALRYLKAYHAHVNYWREVNPTTALAYVDKPDHAPYILEYAAALPDTLIVARIKHDLDGGFHTKPTGAGDTRYYVSSPGDYHRAYGYLGRVPNVVLHIFNEPNGFADADEIERLVQWMAEYINLAIREKTKSVLFNWADRNPQIIAGMFDPRFDEILKKMAEHPELFYMGMHFYGPDEIVSHIESYVTRCERLGIVPPKVIGTEWGLDKHDGSKENGYKSWGWGGLKYAMWQTGQVRNELAPYIKRGVLIGLQCFQEGNSGGWEAFDYENDAAYKDEIKRAALAGELEPVTTKPVPSIPTPQYPSPQLTAGQRYTIVTPGAIRNVRAAPTLGTTEFVGKLSDGSVITALEVKAVGIDWWVRLETADKVVGWVSCDGDRVKYKAVQPPPVVVPPTPPVPYFEVSSEYLFNLAKARRKLSASYLASNEVLRARIKALQAEIESNILLAQDELTVAQNLENIAEQTKLNNAA